MSRPIVFILAAFVATTAIAQVRFTGTVKGDNETPIAFANISVGEEQAFGGITDANGHFAIASVRVGMQRVRVACMGFAKLDTLVNMVDGMTAMGLRLHREAIAMRAAEVTALRVSDRAPFARTVVTRQVIDRINIGVDLPYILEQQPGVVATSDGGTGVGYTYMRIRGTDGTRTNITVNGVSFNDPESQGAFLVNMPDLMTSAEDVEVQRGVGASTNGPAAFGASVNIRTTAVKRDPWALLALSGGSYNTQRYSVSAGTGLIAGKSKSEGFSFDVRLSSVTSDGYVDRASADLKSYFMQGAWIGAKRSLRFVTFRGKEVTYQAWGGVPREVIDTNRTYNGYTYKDQVDNYDQTHYQLLFDQKLSANATMNITLFRILGKGYFEEYKEADDLSTYGIAPAVINGDTITTSDIVRRRWLDNALTGVNASTDIKLGPHRLVVGGSYSDYRGAHFGEVIWAGYAGASKIGDRYYDDDARKTDANAFAKLTFALNEKLDVYGDMQVRSVQHRLLMYNADLTSGLQTIDFVFFNPKAGLLWRVREGSKAYASVAIANREPNREDLQETTPQSRPHSERLTDVEAGYERRTGRTSLGVNGYYMKYDDQLVLTGELNDVGAALRTNVKQSYRAGVELMLAAQITKRLVWRANATISRNKVINFDEYVDDWDNGGQMQKTYAESDLPFSPNIIAGSELAFRVWNSDQVGHGDITFVSKYVVTQYLDLTASADRKLDPFFVNDIRINVTLLGLKGARSIDFNLTARNIFNELYASNGWVYSYMSGGSRQQMVGLYPQAPMNILGGVTVRF
ncbi:MAG TPA: TonB-dependent receptor plug domain-containing protein [Flavobacteriales bacterium]|nr:TonB-dependent receptor plug domain-containing protein [Flavobacteriales bacterium]